jgi:hypothetical protein
MKRYVLVFDDGSGDDLDLKRFVDTLDEGAKMLALDGHLCFLMTRLTVAEISEAFVKFAGSRLFFVSDTSHSDYSGRMPGAFWEEFMRPRQQTAAE